MKKGTLNFGVDAIAFTLFALLVSTGLLVHFTLPAGSGHFKAVWGLDRHQWGEVHFWIAIAMLVAMGVHLFLHWQWIGSMVMGKKGGPSNFRIAAASISLVALLVLAAVPFFSPIEALSTGQIDRPQHGQQEHAQQKSGVGEAVNGSMSLAEVELATGVTVDQLKVDLGLPAEISPDERLGRLRREFGFEIDDVRAAIDAHLATP